MEIQKKRVVMTKSEAEQYRADSYHRKTRPGFLLPWLDYDNWTKEEGLLLLAGLDPDTVSQDASGRIVSGTLLDGVDINVGPAMLGDLRAISDYGRISQTMVRLRKLWDSGTHPEKCPPKYFIEWARSKRFEIPWMDWAEQNGLLTAGERPITTAGEAEGVSNDPASSKPNANSRGYVSNKLAILNQTAQRFWANADPDDRASHPTNLKVVDWLVRHGFTQTMAEKGASIIRPEWAPTGRRPEE